MVKKKRAPRTDRRPKTSMALPPALQKRLKVVAAKEGRTMKAIVIELVEAYLAKTE
jgi:predicted DNA-binding protein